MKSWLNIILLAMIACSQSSAQQFPEKWPQINWWMQQSITNLVDGGVVTNQPTLGYVQPLGSNSWKIYFPVAGVVTQIITYVAPPRYLNVSGGLLSMSGDPTSGVNVIELVPATLLAEGFIKGEGTSYDSWLVGLGSNPIRLRRDANGFSVRNFANDEYRDLICRNLSVLGTNNIYNSNVLNIETNRITLNSNITNGTPVADAYLSISRGSSPTASVQWVEATDEWYLGYDGQMYSVGHYATQAVANAWPQIKTFDASACEAVSNKWPWVVGITPAQIYNWDTIHVWSTNETIDTITNYYPWITNWLETYYADMQIVTNTFVKKAGDTMSGTLDFNSNAITRISLLNFTNDEARVGVALEGDLWYDAATGTLNHRGRYTQSTLQIGMESWVEVLNKTGSTIAEGTPVYVSGGQGGVGTDITVAPAYINGEKTHRCIGLTTTTITNNLTGLVTMYGVVNGLDTSAWTNGTDVYLSENAGVLVGTNTEVYVGTVKRQNANSGQIWVNPHHTPFHNEDEIDPRLSVQNNASLDPTGFEGADSVRLFYTPSSRTMVITNNGNDIKVWWRGTNVNLGKSYTTSAHVTNSGLHYLAMRTSTNLEWSLQPWTFDMAQVAIAYYDHSNTNGWALKETHGLMPWPTHEELHRNIGTYVSSGIETVAGSYVFQDGTANTNVTPAFSAGSVHDEDNHTDISAKGTGDYTRVWFNSGSSVTFTTNSPNMVQVTGTYPDINTWNGTTFSTNEAAINKYFNLWVGVAPMASDARSQGYRLFIVQPQKQHDSLASAQAETTLNLNMSQFTTLGPEYVFRYKITGRTGASYSTIGKWRIEALELLAGNAIQQVSISGATAVNTADAIGTTVAGFDNKLSSSDTTVQKALDTIDNFNFPTNLVIVETTTNQWVRTNDTWYLSIKTNYTSSSSSGITNIVSAGGTSLVYGVSGTVATNKGVIAGSNMTITDNGTNLTFASTASGGGGGVTNLFMANGLPNQTISSGVRTKVNFANELSDTSGNYDSANSRYTASVDGYYVFSASITTPANDLGSIFLYTNGAPYQASGSYGIIGVGYSYIAGSFPPVYLRKDDYAEIYVQINNTTVSGDAVYTTFRGWKN